MRKIGGSIERVDVPAVFPAHAFARALFAVHSMLGKCLSEPSLDQLLDSSIGDGHQIDVALVFGLDALGKKLAELRSGLSSNL